MAYLRYSPDIEQPDADEQETIDGIIQGMTQQSETVEGREKHAVRASHAKSSACVIGELIVTANLPEELAQGLFGKPGTYPVAVRFAQGPGETLGDRVSTHRGMSIKVFSVEGEKLPGHTTNTQDFVLATGSTFPSGTAKGFLRDGTVIGRSASLPEGVKSAVSSTMRNFNRLLHALGTESPKADFFGHPFGHPLADSYFSQAPMRWGDYVAKHPIEWLGRDLGDVKTRVRDAAGNCSRIAGATASILAAGAVPFVLGGDDSVPIPVLAGFEGHGPVTIVQVDAHVDWADEIRGEDKGYGSPMRRIAEMPWVDGMLQIGIRGLGSGEAWQHDDARGWGSKLVTSREWHRDGADEVLGGLATNSRYVLSIDCDGLDPSVFPAVAMPTPGGLSYEDLLALIDGLTARGTIVGVIIAEYVPERDDAARSSALVAARLALTILAKMRQPND